MFQNIINPFGMLVFHIYKWQRTRKVWLDGSFHDLVARDVEEKTDEFYKYVNNLYCTSCNTSRRVFFFLIVTLTYSVFLVFYIKCFDGDGLLCDCVVLFPGFRLKLTLPKVWYSETLLWHF